MIVFVLSLIGMGISEILVLDSFCFGGSTQVGWAALSTMILFFYIGHKGFSYDQKDKEINSLTRSLTLVREQRDEFEAKVAQLQEHVNVLHDDLVEAYTDQYTLEDRLADVSRVLKGEAVSFPGDEELDTPVRGEEMEVDEEDMEVGNMTINPFYYSPLEKRVNVRTEDLHRC